MIRYHQVLFDLVSKYFKITSTSFYSHSHHCLFPGTQICFLIGFLWFQCCTLQYTFQKQLEWSSKTQKWQCHSFAQSLQEVPLVIRSQSQLLTMVDRELHDWLPSPSCSLLGHTEILSHHISLISGCSQMPYPFPGTDYLFSLLDLLLLLLWISQLLVPQGNLLCLSKHNVFL